MSERRNVINACLGFVLMAVCSFAAPFLYAQPKADPLAGVYRVEGRNPDASSYTGAAEIRLVGKAIYNLAWALDGSSGAPQALGVGFIHNKTLIIYYTSTEGTPGLSGCTIKKNQLDCRWISPGVDVPLVENLTKTDGQSLADAVKDVVKPKPVGREV